jgi:hypothetical protein
VDYACVSFAGVPCVNRGDVSMDPLNPLKNIVTAGSDVVLLIVGFVALFLLLLYLSGSSSKR